MAPPVSCRVPSLLSLLSLGFCLLFLFTTLHHHRIYTFQEALLLTKTATLPQASPRCKQYNDSHYQCLPNVFLIGASKAGTTSLVHYLTQDPHTHFVKRRLRPQDHHKEVHRFDRSNYQYTISAIEQLHEYASSPLLSSAEDALVHYTPHYLYAPSLPRDLYRWLSTSESNIAAISKEVKFVVLLREPVERAWSSYWFKQSHLFAQTDGGSAQHFADSWEEGVTARYEYCFTNVYM
jgi:hypothetical protein